MSEPVRYWVESGQLVGVHSPLNIVKAACIEIVKAADFDAIVGVRDRAIQRRDNLLDAANKRNDALRAQVERLNLELADKIKAGLKVCGDNLALRQERDALRAQVEALETRLAHSKELLQ